MSREVKRVAVDFGWPRKKVWPGYCFTTPDCQVATCPDADGSELPWSKEAMCAFHRAIWDAPFVALDPPTGEGWQLWETVSEGSPISPVFRDREGLIDWIASSMYDDSRVGPPLSREQAERFVDAGWAPSGIWVPGEGFFANEHTVGATP